MKHILLFGLITIFQNFAFAQSKLLIQNSPMPELDLALINNIQSGEIKQAKLSDSNGKIRILDFWATWCKPCIAKMPELRKLKNEFPNDLEIILISDEKLEKILPFIQKQQFSFQFVVDDESAISNKFEVSALPFTILLDKKGDIKTINNSSAITSKVMRDLIADKPVNFPKIDRKVVVELADTVQKNIKNREHFTSYNPNFQSFTRDEFNGEYAGRRVCLYNKTIAEMLGALQNWSQSRITSLEIAEEDKSQLYCLDFIFDIKNAPQRANLALEFLVKRFPEKVKITSRKVKGYVLEVGNKIKIPEKADDNVQFLSTATTEDLSVVLGDLFGIPVKNETHFNHRFILTMSKIPADPILIKRILERIGLVLVEKEFIHKRYSL